MAHVVLISPRLDASFWGMEHSMQLLGKRASMPQACLPLLAALTPSEHTVELMDENVEPVDFDRLAEADIVGVTAMYCQAVRAREILGEVKARGVFTVAGGPLVTVEEDFFAGLADAIFIGEAETTWPLFMNEWSQGCQRKRYEQAEMTDMTTVPAPRIDLLKLENYMFASLQISRGCPFQCEFCDIIVTFGRRPRLKTSAQVIAELEAFVQRGVSIVFVVDDNLIGNKRAIKPILEDIIAWQQRNGYPVALFTEASLDLAEDEELMRLMGEAALQTVFIGIESPNEEALIETKKYQNVRPRSGTLLERISRIQNHGIEVFCGMILGFDHDDPSTIEKMAPFIQEARIINALISPLFAIPKTPLHDRLRREGRLASSQNVEFGTNVIPLRMSREMLRSGYIQVMKDVYNPDAYFDRMDALFIEGRFRFKVDELPYWRRHPLFRAKRVLRYYLGFAILQRRLLRAVTETGLHDEYRRRIHNVLRRRPLDPHILFMYVIKVAMHYHYHNMIQAIPAAHSEPAASYVASR